jgi:hypothetical protein
MTPMPARTPSGSMGDGGEQVATKHTTSRADVGDWVEARGPHGQPPRRGEIVELRGRDGHEHYRVRWDEQHESILYPTDGVIDHHDSALAARPSRQH